MLRLHCSESLLGLGCFFSTPVLIFAQVLGNLPHHLTPSCSL